jgi:hypothetical protein
MEETCKICEGTGFRDHDCGDSTCGQEWERCDCCVPRPGDRARLNKRAKREMAASSPEHVAEFGDCVGVVEGYCQPGCPELDVRWEPSGLRYAYPPHHLELVERAKGQAMTREKSSVLEGLEDAVDVAKREKQAVNKVEFDDVRIAGVWSHDQQNLGFTIAWSSNIGFGELQMWTEADGSLQANTETMGREFVTALFQYMARTMRVMDSEVPSFACSCRGDGRGGHAEDCPKLEKSEDARQT